MSISVKKNTVAIEADSLDIYLAVSLKDALFELFEKGKKKVSLDLAAVERISTPGIQVILSAKKTFNEFNILSLSEQLSSELKKMGVEF